MTRLNGNDFLACSLQLFEQKGLLRVQLNNHLPEHRPALQNCFHRTKGKGAPGGSDDQYGSNTDVAGSRLSADKAILKAVLESTMCSHAESSVPSNSSLLGLFLTDKEVEGCSPRTIAYYESTLKPYEAWMEEKTMLSEDGRIVRVDNPWCSFYIDTELAPALDEAGAGNGCSTSTISSSRRKSAARRPSEWSSRNASTAHSSPLSRTAEASPAST